MSVPIAGRDPGGALAKRVRKAFRLLTGSLRVMPDFLIIGAMRSGTTSLYRALHQHPCVMPAFRKEVHFFEKNWRKGLGWYRRHFPLAMTTRWATRAGGARVLTGEASAGYLFDPRGPRRVASVLPDVRLIAILRNPTDRACSHYHHAVWRGRETLGLAEALDREAARLAGERERMLADETYYSQPYFAYSYTTRGRYAEQLAEWRRWFAPERMLILETSAFEADPRATLAAVARFLGLPAEPDVAFRRYNTTSYPPPDAATRRRLVEYFAPHNARLAELLGRRFDWDR